MQVSEAMSGSCQTVQADSKLKAAAQIMRDADVGMLLVNDESGRVIGTITDRDITIRAVAEQVDLDAAGVRECMTKDVVSCYEDDDISDAIHLMEDKQLRRLLVCNRQGEPVGVLAQADIARKLGRSEITGELLQEVSKPSHPH
ncbi:hypothetical protein CAI21_20180 [Alkalilimnicola ehrlichii]|uniref:CBS domain-containing protein n=1 Tax=Alkalilimnicola ehrlichii TaxID=351052 RepID=A0A3E0WIW0_9GAMM|nr:CBS domain-containing protein [Alkalilimnicola ehrlichii]RFA24789.1 hypothetical protein CAI21_20180 [Alkalilimnicola ehrlichii]RFA32047.1 hypothetical protein CAL65_20635 [Alkalilimnicola ehrlichii]